MDQAHPLRIVQRGDEWVRYVVVRDGMEGRVSRSVYYQLAELLESHGDHPGWLGISSLGEFSPLLHESEIT